MSSRRHFLTMLGTLGSTAALGILHLRCSSPQGAGAGASGPIAAGKISETPVGHLGFVSGEPVILGRDAQGLYAMTAICTHEGCDMSQRGSASANGITCDCHGSRFSPVGAVEAGPARAALQHYAVDLSADGTITIQAGTIVDAAKRTPVPSG